MNKKMEDLKNEIMEPVTAQPGGVHMNFNLKAVYYCASNQNRWGKGLTIEEAKNAAGIHTKKVPYEYYVMAAIYNDPEPAQLENLRQCITANQMFGSPEYYTDNRTIEDTEMINHFHVGWLTVEKNY